jgi:RNA polymerase sigma-70 factor, ECF subfamily
MIGESFDGVLAGAQDGDEMAFACLWRETNPLLLRFLRTLARPVAEDAAAETWVQVVRGLGSFRGNEIQFRAWLFTIARNKVVDWRRAQARRPVAPLDDEVAESLLTTRDAAEAALEELSTESALALIATLPPATAEVVLLRVVADLDVATVAATVGRSPGAVRVAVHRGLRRLADSLRRERVTP